MRSSVLRGGPIALAAVVGATLAASPAPAAVRSGAANERVSHGTSSNWSGYVLAGGYYTTASASWTQPAVNCTVTPTAYSAFWVGLDGDTTNTVEQTGTEADCSSGRASYYAWYEMYPKYPVNYSNPVLPGDRLSASVSYAGGSSFVLTLHDATQKWTQTTTQRLKSAKLGSAEAIAEAPSGRGGVLPLADFGTVAFSQSTVNGSLLTAGLQGLEPLTMLTGAGIIKAEPTSINGGGFSDTWHHQ
jgi:hypothetical protein